MKINIDWLFPICAWTTDQPATEVCAPIRNRTSELLFIRRYSNQLSHTGHGSWVTVSNDHVLRGQYTNTGIGWNAETI